MRLVTNTPRTLFLAAVLVLTGIVASGCATKEEVSAIVAESNALMVAPDLANPVSTSGNSWKNAVQRIDALISQNADQEALVASLRARQALLLTVYKQDALAREAWKQVDKAQLKSDRDRAFYLLSDELIWWFKGGPSGAAIDNDQWGERLGPARSEASRSSVKLSSLQFEDESTIERFEMVCNALPVGSDTRLYLEVMRSNIVLRALNDAAVQRVEDRQYLSEHAVRSVERLVLALDPAGQEWLRSNFLSADLPQEADLISMLRSLSQTRKLMKETRNAADGHEPKIAIDQWRPEWVNTLLMPVRAAVVEQAFYVFVLGDDIFTSVSVEQSRQPHRSARQ